MIKLNEEFKYLSFFDQLTNLANRRNFDETLEREFKLAQRQKLPLALFMCDIDYFKLYNDAYGHIAGDKCLSEVAQIIKGVLHRPSDLVCRYGGEEFAVILPNTHLANARNIADKICQAVQAAKIVHASSKASENVSLSIGIATYTGQFKSVSEFIRAADEALYQAKNNGRNCVAFSN